MHILLIQPPSTKRFEIMPIGLAYIGAVLQEHKHIVKALDACAPYAPLSIADILKEIKSFSPDIIGITFTTALCQEAYKLVKEISGLNITTVAGGSHPTAVPAEALNFGFDIVVRGEGEYTMLELIKFLEGKISLSEILGISYKDKDGNLFHNPPRPFIADLDTLPFPATHLFPIKNYMKKQTLYHPDFFWSILTSRGCPNRCIYCASATLGKRYRIRSARNVYREIKQLQQDFNIKYFRFLDDTLTADSKRLNESLDLFIADKEFTIPWDCDSRVDTVSKELLLKMKKAGCHGITYGVESGNPTTLKKIRKGITLEEINRAIDASMNADLVFVINLIIGWPWETEEHIQDTINLVKSIPRYAKCTHQYSLPIPFPATRLYREYHKEYDFTDWWLKNGAYEGDYDEEGHIAFYKLYMRYLNHPFFKNNFFKYPVRIKKTITRTFILAGRLSNQRMFGLYTEKTINMFSRFSAMLYRINPVLERLFFTPLQSEKFKKSIKKLLGTFEHEKRIKNAFTNKKILKKIKILHIIETLSKGGAEKRLFYDLRHIDTNRFSHIVCYIFEGDYFRDEILKLGIPVYNLNLIRNRQFTKAIFGLWKIIKREKPDIIHTQLFAADIYGRIIGKFFRIPVISSIQSSVYDSGLEYFHSFKRRWLDSFTSRLCNKRFIAVSDFVKAAAVKSLGIQEKKITVIHNYIDTEEFNIVNCDRLKKRVALGFDEQDVLLIMVGKLNPPKGQMYLLHAMKQIIEYSPLTKLLIVGDGPSREELLRIRDELNLGSFVFFLGKRNDVKELLCASDIFVFSSLSEGFPVALIEAMALGKPSIAFNVGPMPELVIHNETGLLVEPKNIRALSEAVLNLINNPEIAHRLGFSAKKHVFEKLDARKKVIALEQLYKEIYNKK
jgi:magnesium-protoporphyrin IX monomethyl ester (oxidative) cyclase